MLPRAHRLVDSRGFTTATRGRRCGGRGVVVHLAAGPGGSAAVSSSGVAPARVGLIVSKAVGDSVRRNLVKRRLRHLLRGQVGRWPAGAVVAVRALPASAAMSSDDLSRDLQRCLTRLDLGWTSVPGAAPSAVPA